MEQKLRYKTRGDSSPQGKQRVFFCCHSDDFARYFEGISDDILKTQNCAIYYYDIDAAVTAEERETDLSQMALFVMPVTTKLLTTNNQALQDFRFAQEHHIPVLPLMQESGLDGVFNKVCGDLQYLDKHARDATTEPYEKKLEKYLAAVLVGDEMAEKIRAAFDAYIFLSYRKKDRKLAQELMRLIHKNPFCRDIAIWYDEYLTPGEDFNQAIQDALKKCELFTLVVTPSLLEPNNYVMEHEYPMAKETGKPILPTQMAETDEDALTEHFDGIGVCTDAHDDDALRQLFLETIEQLAIKTNDSDPQHCFFMGLAYLGGIDVEIDNDRAVKLITYAAEHEIPEAMEKLVDMYNTGDGVERNYHTAIEWQEKLAAYWENRYEQEKSEENGRRLSLEFSHLGDAYRAVGKVSRAKQAYEDLQKLEQELYETYPSYWTKGNLSVSYGLLGNIAQAQGKLSEAKAWYEKKLEIEQQLAEETGIVEAQRNLSVSYNNLGSIAQAQGKLSEAKAWYEKSLEIEQQLAEETGIVDARRDLSLSYGKLGSIAQAEGNLSEAKAWYEKSLEIDRQLAEEAGTVDARRDLTISYEGLGDIAEAQGNLSEAKAWYEKSLEIRKQLEEETGMVQARRDLSISYERLGNIARADGKLSEAKAWYEKLLELSQQLAEETGTVDARRNLSVSYNELGNIAEAEGNLSEAKAWYEKSLEIRKQLAEETGTVQARRDLSVSYNKLGNIAEADGKLSEAKAWYEKDLKISEQLAEETGTMQSYDDLAISHYKLAMLDPSDTQHLETAWKIWSLLAEQFPQITRLTKRRDIAADLLNQFGNS